MASYALRLAMLLVAALIGFYLGRAYPAHRYQQFGQTRYLFDEARGRICDPAVIGKSATEQSAANGNQPDIFSQRAQALKDAGPSPVPACGKE